PRRAVSGPSGRRRASLAPFWWSRRGSPATFEFFEQLRVSEGVRPAGLALAVLPAAQGAACDSDRLGQFLGTDPGLPSDLSCAAGGEQLPGPADHDQLVSVHRTCTGFLSGHATARIGALCARLCRVHGSYRTPVLAQTPHRKITV